MVSKYIVNSCANGLVGYNTFCGFSKIVKKFKLFRMDVPQEETDLKSTHCWDMWSTDIILVLAAHVLNFLAIFYFLAR